MNNDKPLREMSPDEIAQLKPEQFQDLAHDHNDHLELKENARQRQLEDDSWFSHDGDMPHHDESGLACDPMIDGHEEALPNPDREVEEVLKGLFKDRSMESPPPPDRKTLVQAVVGAVKEWKAQKSEDRYDRSGEEGTLPRPGQVEMRAKREAAKEQDLQGATAKPPQSRDRW